MPPNSCAAIYGTLTIGDGLVAQVPALIISTAAGILVTRVATEDDFSEQLSKQMSSNQNALMVSGAVLALLGVLPGMPHMTFLIFAAMFGALAYMIKRKAALVATDSAAQTHSESGRQELGWADVPVVEPLCLELPYRLIPMVDKGEDSDLIKRIRAIRRKFITDMGFLTPSVHIRDNLQLPPRDLPLHDLWWRGGARPVPARPLAGHCARGRGAHARLANQRPFLWHARHLD